MDEKVREESKRLDSVERSVSASNRDTYQAFTDLQCISHAYVSHFLETHHCKF